MRKIAYYIVHTFLYYVAWALGILFAAHGKGWESFFIILAFTCVQFVLEYRITLNKDALIGMTLLLTAAGMVVDTVWVVTGIVVFNGNPFAGYFTSPWMVGLWLSFAVFTYATKPFDYFNLYILSAFAFLGFSLVYAIGAKLGAAYFPYGQVKTSVVIGIVWCIFFPLFIKYWRILYLED